MHVCWMGGRVGPNHCEHVRIWDARRKVIIVRNIHQEREGRREGSPHRLLNNVLPIMGCFHLSLLSCFYKKMAWILLLTVETPL